MKTLSIGFIGAGRITRIFLHAFQNKEIGFRSVKIFDVNKDVSAKLKSEFPDITVSGSAKEAADSEMVFIALHPPVIMEMLNEISGAIGGDAAVVSLAPKISIEKMRGVLSTNNIARLIPNATSFINQGYNPVCFADRFDKDKKDLVLQLLTTLGDTFEVAEKKLESYAIVSAMLPTYFWFQWKKMIEIGVETGMTEHESTKAVHQTLLASLALMFESGMDYAQVTDLIPVKPIGDHEEEIKQILEQKLLGLHQKIKSS